ncbi:SPRY-domain-containing protein [Coniochaeta ligniaria NRRL 30616]|uniref:SPRY-domain-containing protein n=1 Tax=Coniochaeta ligniaria NRRL 30616 TaxID=1408157 RepID=A0A1J7J321_9PEZI|nr:SPRY-domain-containing protein [Coniochaeta ligniaria NRRL 30616]
MYGLSLNDFTGDETASPTAIPGASQRRSSYASVAANRARSARAGAVSHLLNPSSPDESDDTMHRGHFYSSVRDYERNPMARTGGSTDRQSSHHEPAPGIFPPKTSGLPWHSRAYDFFMSRDSYLPDELSSDGTHSRASKFLSPSYLRGTVYMDKLEEQHKRKLLALKEGQHSHTHGGGSSGLISSGSSLSLHNSKLPPPSHRGMTLDVVEKPPKFVEEDDGAVSPLPSRWNKDDKHGALEVVGDGYDVKYIGPKSSSEKEHEACAIRADHFMPGQCGVYYFEVTVISRKHSDTTVVIGFSSKTVSLSRAPGWEPESWGYHGDDGNVFAAQSVGKVYGPKYGPGDTVGCLVNFRTGTVNFTKNGDDHGIAFRDVNLREGKGRYYPTIGLKKPGDHVFANFGQMPFQFDIDGYVKMEKANIWEKIRQSDTSKLVPGLNETELIQQLVLQHLQHDGYVETARAFAEEIVAEKTRLRLDPEEPVASINVRDDEDARKRQQIRRAILEGNIDQALKFTNTYYPKVLNSNNEVYFRLRCRKFIEMIRKDAEENLKRDKSQQAEDTASAKPSQQFEDEDMELDEGGEWGEPMEDDRSPAVGQLLQEALEYGQELRAEFADSTGADPEMSKQLDEIFALIAYQNPLKEEGVKHLLDRSGRVAVAEELNSAILLSLGKSSRSALETMYAQTVVLLEQLREDGGDGAFVAIQDIMDRITKPVIRS